MRTLNLGILAHVDAGKTSLTERLLFEAGAIPELGSVDAGTTRTDSLDIERRRGITVRTNVASFVQGDIQVNLIDTPGHSDFIAEVERSLAVLDAAVLVVSAVEGVQPQTVVLWRVLRRLAVPVAIFINKIDRQGADPARVRAGIGRRLAEGSGARLLPLTDVLAAGSASATTTPVPLTDPSVIDVLTSGDDWLLGAVLDGPGVTEAKALRSARTQVAQGAVVPVAAGSALTGAGVPDLLAALPRLMPWARPADRSLSGVIYTIEHGDHGTLAHCRMFGGELSLRDRAAASGARPGVITSIERSTPGGWARVTAARAGDVVRIRGIGSARTGGWIGEAIKGRITRQFPAPALESVLIHQALEQAGTVVCEPVENFQLEIPASALPAVTMTIARLAGLITGTRTSAGALALTGTIPTRSVQLLLAQLPEQTSGEGVFTSEVTHYTPVTGPPPARTRIGPNPLDRQEWFRARPR